MRIGSQLVRWKAIEIRMRPDEYLEMTIALEPDAVDVAALQENTRLIIEQRGEL